HTSTSPTHSPSLHDALPISIGRETIHPPAPASQPAFRRRGFALPFAGSSLSFKILVSRSITSEVSGLAPVKKASNVFMFVSARLDRKSTRLNSSHVASSYAV